MPTNNVPSTPLDEVYKVEAVFTGVVTIPANLLPELDISELVKFGTSKVTDALASVAPAGAEIDSTVKVGGGLRTAVVAPE